MKGGGVIYDCDNALRPLRFLSAEHSFVLLAEGPSSAHFPSQQRRMKSPPTTPPLFGTKVQQIVEQDPPPPDLSKVLVWENV